MSKGADAFHQLSVLIETPVSPTGVKVFLDSHVNSNNNHVRLYKNTLEISCVLVLCIIILKLSQIKSQILFQL